MENTWFLFAKMFTYTQTIYIPSGCVWGLSQNESRETAPERVQQEDAIVENESNNIIRKLNAGKYEKPRKWVEQKSN